VRSDDRGNVPLVSLQRVSKRHRMRVARGCRPSTRLSGGSITP